MKKCVKCDGNLKSPEIEIFKKLQGAFAQEELHLEKNRKDRNEICWRCHTEYWGGIESIFNQFGMDKHDVFFMIVDYIERKIEDEELSDVEIKKYISQRLRIDHIPF